MAGAEMRYFEFYHSYDDDGGCAIAEMDAAGPAWDLIGLVMAGKFQTQMPPPMPIKIISEGELKDIRFGTLGIPLFSSRAADVIADAAKGDVQLLPAKLGEDEESRRVINILSEVDCLDVAKSKISGGLRPDGTPKAVLRPALRVDSIKGQNLFRVKTYRQLIIVSETVKDAIQAAKLTGPVFEEVWYANESTA